jgi:hypothetical protein
MGHTLWVNRRLGYRPSGDFILEVSVSPVPENLPLQLHLTSILAMRATQVKSMERTAT